MKLSKAILVPNKSNFDSSSETIDDPVAIPV
jgi:hypothetical protein